jgi:hypothetical protein
VGYRAPSVDELKLIRSGDLVMTNKRVILLSTIGDNKSIRWNAVVRVSMESHNTFELEKATGKSPVIDVKDATNPKLVHKEKIGTRGSSSEAATNHLAFNWMPSEGLLALPMTICEGGGDGKQGDNLTFSGLLVYDVDLDRGFTRLGGVDHGTKGASCQTWWSNANSTVKRSVFLDDLVYSIAEDRVKVQNMNHFGRDIADMSFAER